MKFLDLPRRQKDADKYALAAEFYEVTKKMVGTISAVESEFLLSTLAELDASRIVEIGVSSGASSLHMLALFERMGGERNLFAFDVLNRYYGDPSKPVGFLAIESPYNLGGRYKLESGAFAADAREAIGFDAEIAGTFLDAAFVDGSHRHPWATIDFLLLVGLIRDGGAVIFHDINLPSLTKLDEDFGPRILFSQPFASREVIRGDAPNIGSLRIFDKAGMIDLALDALESNWEVCPSQSQIDKIVLETSQFLSLHQLERLRRALSTKGNS